MFITQRDVSDLEALAKKIHDALNRRLPKQEVVVLAGTLADLVKVVTFRVQTKGLHEGGEPRYSTEKTPDYRDLSPREQQMELCSVFMTRFK